MTYSTHVRQASAEWALRAALWVVTASWPIAATADAPAFDRPGIAFAPSTLPAHSLAWEQGLPDFQRDRADGTTQKAYAMSSRLRAGLTDSLELQLAAPLYEEIDTSGAGRGFVTAGSGDVSLGMKFSHPTGSERLSWAALAVISVPSGKRDLGNGTEQYSLGGTLGWAISDQQSAALYANVDVLRGDATWTVSPNWSFSVSDTVGAYVEAGYQSTSGSPANEVAGGGITWMARPTVQLDLYGLAGLTHRSTDLAAGCGISVFFP